MGGLTQEIRIYMAGDVAQARIAIRKHCYENGACVTVTPTQFIYTGGEESGFIVGFINYLRYPDTSDSLWSRAETLARLLLVACNQRSCSIVSAEKSVLVVLDPPGASRG